MQTLTRLLARLWEALFPKTNQHAQPARRSWRSSSTGRGMYSIPRAPEPSGRSPATFTDPDDITFCAHMYYLN